MLIISGLVNSICVPKSIYVVPKNTIVIILKCSLCIHIDEMIDKTEIGALQRHANLKLIKKPIAIPKLLDEVASILN